MSLKIPQERLDSGDLTEVEYKILQDQGKLPKGLPRRPELTVNPNAPALETLPNTGTVNPLREPATPIEEQELPTIQDQGGIIHDADGLPAELVGIPFDESPWTNEKRRARLVDLGLKVTGGKDELNKRLERHRDDLLTDDDYEEDEDD